MIPRTPALVRALRASTTPTWMWERCIVLLVEAFCWLGMAAAAPAGAPRRIALLGGAVGILGAMTAQAQRSIAARRREESARRGIPTVELHCEEAATRWARTQTMLAGASPIVALLLAVVGPGLTRAAAAGAACMLIRWCYAEGYAVWRTWYVARRAAWQLEVTPALGGTWRAVVGDRIVEGRGPVPQRGQPVGLDEDGRVVALSAPTPPPWRP